MQSFDSIPRYDTLNLFEKSLQVRQLIGDQQLVFYSCEIQKFNRYGFQQDRILVITNELMLTLLKGSHNFIEHRRVPINIVNGFTVSKDTKKHELVIHCYQDYDERFNCGAADHKRNLINLL